MRKQKEKAKEVLTQKSAQFRTVQRQLLIKLKDDTPTPMAHLDELAEMTYRQVTCRRYIDEIFDLFMREIDSFADNRLGRRNNGHRRYTTIPLQFA